MASHLTPKQIEEIVALIGDWPLGTKLTWEELLRLVVRRIRISPTRQTLARIPEVLSAFRTRKTSLRNYREPSCEERVLVETNRRLSVDNDRLRAKTDLYLERLALLQYNAYKHGLKKHELEAPLPFINRKS